MKHANGPKHVRRRNTAWIVAAVCLLLALCGRAAAQEENKQETTPDAFPPERASARDTVQTFLKTWQKIDGAVGEERQRLIQQVLATLDLSEIPPAFREEQGETIAFQLKSEVIDKYSVVDYEKIPNDPNGEPYVLVHSPQGLQIVVAAVKNRGWQFTKESVENVPAIAAEFSGRKTLAGVYEIQTLKPPALALQEQLPPWMKRQAVFLYVYQWIGIVALAIGALIVGRALVYILLAALGGRLRRGGWMTESDLARVFSWPPGVAFAVLLWWLLDSWLLLPPSATRIAQSIAVIVFGVGVITTLMRLIDVISGRLANVANRTHNRFDDLIIPFARKSAKIVVMIVGPLMVLDSLGMDLTTAVGTLAIGGLAISLAAKDMVSNLFGTVTIVGDSPFQIGDWISVSGVEGTVESLGFRSTRVRTFYDSMITIPNANLTNAIVDNYGARRYRRYSTKISVAYSTPTDRMEAFCEGIREIVRKHPYTRKDYYHVYFTEFSASSLDILVYVFFEAPDWATELREKHRLNADIHRLASQLGVEFAFQTQTLYLGRQGGLPKPAESNVADPRRLGEELNAARKGVAAILEAEGTARPSPVDFSKPRSMTNAPPS